MAGLGDPVPQADYWVGMSPLRQSLGLSVAPFAVDLLAVAGADELPDADVLRIWRGAVGPFGRVIHHRLAELLVAPDPALRAEASATVAELAGQGRLDAAMLAGRCLELVRDGRFSLARAATGFEQAIVASAGAAVWPSLSAVLEAVSSASGPGRTAWRTCCGWRADT